MALKSAAAAVIATGALIAVFFPAGSHATADAAQFVRCTANPISVTAVGRGMWGTTARTTSSAIASWQSTAAQSIGPYYADWTHSLGANIDCHRELFKVTCTASATPCRS